MTSPDWARIGELKKIVEDYGVPRDEWERALEELRHIYANVVNRYSTPDQRAEDDRRIVEKARRGRVLHDHGRSRGG